jgi:hypothetical protein
MIEVVRSPIMAISRRQEMSLAVEVPFEKFHSLGRENQKAKS